MKRIAQIVPLRAPGSRAAIAAELHTLAVRVESGDVDAVALAIQRGDGRPEYDAHLVRDRGDTSTLLVATDGLLARLRSSVWGGSRED